MGVGGLRVPPTLVLQEEAKMAKRKKKWIQPAVEKMKEKGTLGSFGKATPKKIARAKREGGKQEKKAIFAQNMKRAAARRRGRRSRRR